MSNSGRSFFAHDNQSSGATESERRAPRATVLPLSLSGLLCSSSLIPDSGCGTAFSESGGTAWVRLVPKESWFCVAEHIDTTLSCGSGLVVRLGYGLGTAFFWSESSKSAKGRKKSSDAPPLRSSTNPRFTSHSTKRRSCPLVNRSPPMPWCASTSKTSPSPCHETLRGFPTIPVV